MQPPPRSRIAFALLAALLLPGSSPAQEPSAAASPKPADAPKTPDAQALWNGLIQAAAGEQQGRITAFELDFDATQYSGEKQSNDVGATYSYMEPNFLRMVLRSGRVRMSSPKGAFLQDKTGVHKLEGRDFAQDLKEVEDSLAVARIFVHLTDPRGVRVESLTALPAAPGGMPAATRKLAAELDWISLVSPDFRGPRAKEGAPSDRVELGLERGTHLPRLAIVTDPSLLERALILQLGDYTQLDGFRVPGRVTTWRIDPELHPPAFGERAAFDLWLKSGTLRPKLEPAHFEPKAKQQ
jgi:hypothetical protein